MDEEYDYPKFQIGAYIKTGRYLMFVFNSILFVFASMLFAFCMWIRFDPDFDDYVRNLSMDHYYTGVIVVMIGAFLVMLASFMGCCGAHFWYMPLIIMFAVTSGISFCLNFSGATYLLMIGLESTDAYPFIQENFRNLIYQYNYNMDAKRTVDIIQEYIGCCGGYSSGDWQAIHMPVPNTCRNQVTGNDYGDSCAEVLSWYLEFRTGCVSGIALCICFLQLFTGIFAICMYRGIRQRRAAFVEEYGLEKEDSD